MRFTALFLLAVFIAEAQVRYVPPKRGRDAIGEDQTASSGLTETGNAFSIDSTVTATLNIVTITSSGTDTYTGTIPTPFAYTAGHMIRCKFDVTNDGAATININSLGAKSIKLPSGIDPDDGDLSTTVHQLLIYDGTNFVLISPLYRSIVFSSATSDTVAAATTEYFSLGSTSNATETNRMFIAPTALTVFKLCAVTGGAQPADGTLVFTLRKNAGDTAITFTIAAAAGAGTYCDNTNSVSYAQGDTMSLKAVNGSPGTASATIRGWGFVTR